MPAALDERRVGPSRLTLDDLIVVEENERGSVGARLHDGPLQDLLATRYLTDLALRAAARGADVDALRAQLEAIRAAASTALAGHRKLLAELTARATTGRGLAGALRAAAASIAPAALVETGDAHDGELGELPPAVAVTAYRLAVCLLRVCETVSPVLRVRRTGDTLVVDLDSPVALAEPEVAGWVARAVAIGGSVASGATVHAVFPLVAGYRNAAAAEHDGQL